MPDPIELAPGGSHEYKPMSDIARKITTDEGQTLYMAGPDAVAKGKAENVGDFVSAEYASRARSMRQYWNAVKQNVDKQEMDTQEARTYVSEKTEELREEQAKDEPDQDRIDRIKEQLGGS